MWKVEVWYEARRGDWPASGVSEYKMRHMAVKAYDLFRARNVYQVRLTSPEGKIVRQWQRGGVGI
jgi:hypothetical protein